MQCPKNVIILNSAFTIMMFILQKCHCTLLSADGGCHARMRIIVGLEPFLISTVAVGLVLPAEFIFGNNSHSIQQVWKPKSPGTSCMYKPVRAQAMSSLPHWVVEVGSWLFSEHPPWRIPPRSKSLIRLYNGKILISINPGLINHCLFEKDLPPKVSKSGDLLLKWDHPK